MGPKEYTFVALKINNNRCDPQFYLEHPHLKGEAPKTLYSKGALGLISAINLSMRMHHEPIVEGIVKIFMGENSGIKADEYIVEHVSECKHIATLPSTLILETLLEGMLKE